MNTKQTDWPIFTADMNLSVFPCKKSVPGAPVCVCGKPSDYMLKTERQNPSSFSCGNHFIFFTVTNLWISPILLHLTSCHTGGANPTMVLSPLDGCQLCFLFRWNMPPPIKSITPSSSQLLSSYLWTEPGVWDYGNIWPTTFDPLRRPRTPLSCLPPAITQSDDSLKGDRK